MARVRINSAAARELLTSDEVAGELAKRAQRICDMAISMTGDDDMLNDPYGFSVSTDGTRARATVFTRNPHAVHSNNKHNTLLKSIDAGR